MEKGYYNSVIVLLNLNKEYGVDRKKNKSDMDPDPDEEYMEDVRLDGRRECHWRMGLEDNGGGVEDKKELLHAKRWDVYMN